MMNDRVIHVDSRGRVSLGRYGVKANTWYKATVNEHGTVVLVPLEFKEAVEDTLSKATGLPRERIHTDRHPLDMD